MKPRKWGNKTKNSDAFNWAIVINPNYQMHNSSIDKDRIDSANSIKDRIDSANSRRHL